MKQPPIVTRFFFIRFSTHHPLFFMFFFLSANFYMKKWFLLYRKFWQLMNRKTWKGREVIEMEKRTMENRKKWQIHFAILNSHLKTYSTPLFKLQLYQKIINTGQKEREKKSLWNPFSSLRKSKSFEDFKPHSCQALVDYKKKMQRPRSNPSNHTYIPSRLEITGLSIIGKWKKCRGVIFGS